MLPQIFHYVKPPQSQLSYIRIVQKNINDLKKYEWDRIIYLSKQTRHHIRNIDDTDLFKIYYGRYSDLCKNYQIYDNNKMIANCFIDRVKLFNNDSTFISNYLTGLNRDLDSKYKGIGSLFLNIILTHKKLVYLKPANENLEIMYKSLNFIPTNLKGIGNCRFPIYVKYSDSDFPKDEFNEKCILK